jgi:BirA family biotin operon repressor/biotin-[acetyl-CoA-carboxylase] ligase
MELSSAGLQERLQRPLRYYESVGSTNDLAKAWLLEGAPEGGVVIANEQLRGRGRNGRVWHTPPDVALAVSMILCPPRQFVNRLTMIGALAVYDLAVAAGCKQVGIKWPNDVQVDGKKVAGILPEAVWQGQLLRAVILGIGVNVRVEFADADLRDRAISLEVALGRRLDRAELLRTLLTRLDIWYAQIAAEETFQIWKDRLNMFGKRINGFRYAGRALDVTADGSLIIVGDDGRRRTVRAGDIAVCDEPGAGG